MKRLLFVLALAAVVAGCKTTHGTGPITLSPQIQAGLDRYMNSSDNVGYFAVAIDGRSSYNYVYCPDQRCLGMDTSRAIRACEKYSNGVPCRIYAYRKEIVWQFDKQADSN